MGYFFFKWSVKQHKTLQFHSMFVVHKKNADNFVFPTEPIVLHPMYNTETL